MTEFQFDLDGLIIDAQIDGAAITAFGSHAPRLMFPVNFKVVRGSQGYAFELTSLYAELLTDSPREHIVSADPCPLCRFARNAGLAHLYFPISHATLHWLEVVRNGGERLSFFLNLKLTAKKLLIIQAAPVGAPHQYVSETCSFKQGVMHVPRDIWCNRVLAETKFGKVHVVEVPAVPVEQCAALGNAFAALREAERFHRLGFYAQAVGQCRVALDKFWTGRNPKKLDQDWLPRVGETSYRWLNELFTIIRQESNDPHHTATQPSGPKFDQFDSQMFIAVTTAFVAYVARRGVSEKS